MNVNMNAFKTTTGSNFSNSQGPDRGDRDQGRDRDRGPNNFKSRSYVAPVIVPIVANFLETDFPDLIVKDPLLSDQAIKPSINYKGAVVAITDLSKKSDVPPGCVKYTCDKKSKIITVDYGTSVSTSVSSVISVSTVTSVISVVKTDVKDPNIYNELMYKLESNWAQYAENYIQIYGNDYYDHYHLMPNYVPHLDYDSSSNGDYDGSGIQDNYDNYDNSDVDYY